MWVWQGGLGDYGGELGAVQGTDPIYGSSMEEVLESTLEVAGGGGTGGELSWAQGVGRASCAAGRGLFVFLVNFPKTSCVAGFPVRAQPHRSPSPGW